jgi:hypothetical protein
MTGLVDELGEIDPGPDGRERLRQWLENFVANYGEYGPVIRAWLEDQAKDPLLLAVGNDMFGDIAERFAAHVEQGAMSDVLDPAAAAVAWVAMIERFTYFLTSRDLPFDRERVLDTLAVMVHRGFLRGAASAAAQ